MLEKWIILLKGCSKSLLTVCGFKIAIAILEQLADKREVHDKAYLLMKQGVQTLPVVGMTFVLVMLATTVLDIKMENTYE